MWSASNSKSCQASSAANSIINRRAQYTSAGPP